MAAGPASCSPQGGAQEPGPSPSSFFSFHSRLGRTGGSAGATGQWSRAGRTNRPQLWGWRSGLRELSRREALASSASRTSPPTDAVPLEESMKSLPVPSAQRRGEGRHLTLAGPGPHPLASEGAGASVRVPGSWPLLHLLLSTSRGPGGTSAEPQTPEGQSRCVRCCCPQHGPQECSGARVEAPPGDRELRGGARKRRVREDPRGASRSRLRTLSGPPGHPCLPRRARPTKLLGKGSMAPPVWELPPMGRGRPAEAD